jgi:hypothetical protein
MTSLSGSRLRALTSPAARLKPWLLKPWFLKATATEGYPFTSFRNFWVCPGSRQRTSSVNTAFLFQLSKNLTSTAKQRFSMPPRAAVSADNFDFVAITIGHTYSNYPIYDLLPFVIVLASLASPAFCAGAFGFRATAPAPPNSSERLPLCFPFEYRRIRVRGYPCPSGVWMRRGQTVCGKVRICSSGASRQGSRDAKSAKAQVGRGGLCRS